MIDIHTHILPNVDDGSESLSQSILILKSEIEQGVDSVVLTPHFKDKYRASVDDIKKTFNILCEEVKKQELPIKLYLGQEVYCLMDIKKMLQEESVLTLNGSKYILLEFDYESDKRALDKIYELSVKGYIPIVAHIERYKYLKFYDYLEIKAMGGLLQVNADALVGHKKKFYYKKVKKLFKIGAVDFIASDIHFCRDNCIKQAREFIEKKFGIEYAKRLFTENAKDIIDG